MNKHEYFEEIRRMKKEKNAVIVAHNYQVDNVQEIADKIGDSLFLSRYCAQTDADVIVFCGVHFMAESASILSPEKTVLLPERNAGCPMADMVTAEELREKKKLHPNAAVVCYINSSAEVKAESDICCTSSNALAVVKSLKEEEIIFVPDQNLGAYIAKMVPEKRIILWKGFCITHHRVGIEEVKKVREAQPDAVLLVHPECRPEVALAGDFVGSTQAIVNYVEKSDKQKFIIGTEMGILYTLKKYNPEKTFYMLSQGMVCPNMKKTSIKSVYDSLKEMKYRIELDDDTRNRARKALEEMLKIV